MLFSCINDFFFKLFSFLFLFQVSVEMLTGVTKEFQDGFPVFLRKFHAVSAALSPSESFPSLRFLPVVRIVTFDRSEPPNHPSTKMELNNLQLGFKCAQCTHTLDFFFRPNHKLCVIMRPPNSVFW